LPAGGMSVRELVFLGFARLPLDFHPPTGFARVEERRIQHIALARYRAAIPGEVTPGQSQHTAASARVELFWIPGRQAEARLPAPYAPARP
jgi:hypothetical protein